MAQLSWVEDWLSAPRLAVYLSATDGDRAAALTLYEWNAAVSSAFHHDLGHLEVGLRNAYDRALSATVSSGRPHWVFDSHRHFPVRRRRAANDTVIDSNMKQREQIEAAVRSARRDSGSASPPAGKVIAELSFGFWRYLTTQARDADLWVPRPHRAFRPGTSRTDVDRPVSRLHVLRNRVAHHEPLIDSRLDDRHHDVLAVAGLLSRPLRDHLEAHSAVPALLLQRPR